MPSDEPALKYNHDMLRGENDSVPLPQTKRTLMYGWDSENLQKVRLSVDANGVLKSTTSFQVNDFEELTDILYVGMENADGTWWLKKLDESSTPSTLQHATVKNNPSTTSYTTAWTNRATLTYGDYSDAE